MADLFTVQDRISAAQEYLRHYEEQKYRTELELKVAEALDEQDTESKQQRDALSERIAKYDIAIGKIKEELADLVGA